jgi:hypothetical protein
MLMLANNDEKIIRMDGPAAGWDASHVLQRLARDHLAVLDDGDGSQTARGPFRGVGRLQYTPVLLNYSRVAGEVARCDPTADDATGPRPDTHSSGRRLVQQQQREPVHDDDVQGQGQALPLPAGHVLKRLRAYSLACPNEVSPLRRIITILPANRPRRD